MEGYKTCVVVSAVFRNTWGWNRVKNAEFYDVYPIYNTPLMFVFVAAVWPIQHTSNTQYYKLIYYSFKLHKSHESVTVPPDNLWRVSCHSKHCVLLYIIKERQKHRVSHRREMLRELLCNKTPFKKVNTELIQTYSMCCVTCTVKRV